MKRYFDTVKTLVKIANKKTFVVIQMFLSCCLYNLCSLLPPIATAGIVAIITQNNFNGIWFYVFLYMLFYIIYFTSLHWNYHTYTVLANYYHLEVQKKLFDHIANNDSIFDKVSKGKIVDTSSDDIRYLVDVMNAASEALIRFLELIIIFIIFSYYNIIVALIALVIDLLYLLLMNNNSKKVAKHYEGTRKYEDKIIDTLNQILLNIKEVRSLNMMPSLDKKLTKTRSKWKEEYNKKRNMLVNRYCRMPYIVYIGKILLYIFLAYLVCNGTIKIDKLILLISYFELTITCTDSMLTYLLELSNYGIRVKRIDNILQYSTSNNIDFGDITNDYINGTVTFDKVYYNIKDKMILNNVSFKIYPNEITVIVGHSGSGKTTILNLLYRLDRIKSGSISIDNENIYNFDRKTYSSNVTGVFQKPFVFEMSIKENLSLVDNNHDNQIEACKRVGIHKTIMNLPKGYNTIISDNSRLLSEGEKQLLVIARSLLTKSEIIVFDEVASNIDPNTTEIIENVITDLKQDHTIIIVTHKPEMMKIADRVIVLDKGKVVSKGTNEEVYKKCELYRNLRNRYYVSVSKNN